ncbi:hypothetical protein DFH06DRAFT_1119445 [Mycena polygramma]|nr:hypothetical protein DFH06DRAFT_1125582 [Mycena polygramma]KAJ7682136.1 hypothetical protein DFH06DRAFT_1119445 [Mycena polygramma]
MAVHTSTIARNSRSCWRAISPCRMKKLRATQRRERSWRCWARGRAHARHATSPGHQRQFCRGSGSSTAGDLRMRRKRQNYMHFWDGRLTHELAMRVEWCRAKARKVRWEEEVLLLREEMRRVLRYLEWEAETWKQRAVAREDESPELRQGLSAYALRHEAMYRELGTFFKGEWNLSPGEAASAVVREPLEDGADLVGLFEGRGEVSEE